MTNDPIREILEEGSDKALDTFLAGLTDQSRRAFDSLMLRTIMSFHRKTDSRLDRLEGRVNILFAGLAVLTVVVQIVLPIIEKLLFRG